MSVDRTGRAWVLYTSGEVFHTRIDNTSTCTPSDYTPLQGGVELFGMGFVSDGVGSASEKLFIAGGNASVPQGVDATFGTVDPITAVLTTVGTVAVDEYPPELTGTGNGRVYGYLPGASATTVAEFDRTSGDAVRSWSLGGLGMQVRAWAFAHWGRPFLHLHYHQSRYGDQRHDV